MDGCVDPSRHPTGCRASGISDETIQGRLATVGLAALLSAATYSSHQTETWKCGDIDLNGSLTIDDAITGLKSIVGTVDASPVQDFLVDLNRNGQADIVCRVRPQMLFYLHIESSRQELGPTN